LCSGSGLPKAKKLRLHLGDYSIHQHKQVFASKAWLEDNPKVQQNMLHLRRRKVESEPGAHD